MTLPKQVEQQLKEVEELEKQLQAPMEQATVEETAVEYPPDMPEESTPDVTPTQAVERVEPQVDWEQKYRTIAGKYDAEVPRLHAQVKELMAQMQMMQERQQAPAPESKTQDRLVTDDDVSLWGQDMIDVTRKVALEVAREYDSKLEAAYNKIEQLERSLVQTGSQVGEMTFEQRLHRAIPDFDAVNTDPRWIAWLDEVLPDVGAPRRVFAEQAYNNGDVEGVKRFVDVFRQAAAPAQPDNRRAELERQVAPSRATGNAQVPNQPRSYSLNQMDTLWNKVRELNVKGKHDEAAKLEAELTAAYVEGRVTT